MWGLLRGAAFVAVVTTSGVVGWKLGGESAVAEVLVLQERTCGCCAKWSDHLRAQGFAVRVREIGAMEHQMLRDALGIDPAFASCHAALVGD